MCPLNYQIFMWLDLKKKVLTQDILCKRGTNGTWFFILYKQCNESIDDFLWNCPESMRVWLELENILGMRGSWSGVSHEENLNTRCKEKTIKNVKSLPVLAMWG